MDSYKTEGIVLKRINFGEADKIITLFTKHHGKVVCLAKGVRRLTSRKRGNLEIFSRVKFFAVRGKSMDIVTETELIESFSDWRGDLKKVTVAYQLCEIVDKLTAEKSEQEEVFTLLSSYLGKLEQAENYESYVDYFGGNILKILGYWPRTKPFPRDFSVSGYIEEISERELKSKKFFRNL